MRVAAPPHVDDDAVRLAASCAWVDPPPAGRVRTAGPAVAAGAGDRRELLRRRSALPAARGRARRSGGKVRLTGNSTLTLHARPGDGRDARDAVLQRWCRRLLRERLPGLLAKWEPRVGVAADVRIRRMKTRWGSCNPHARRVWLNPELAREAARLRRVRPGARSRPPARAPPHRSVSALMDRFLPRWRRHRDDTEPSPARARGVDAGCASTGHLRLRDPRATQRSDMMRSI